MGYSIKNRLRFLSIALCLSTFGVYNSYAQRPLLNTHYRIQVDLSKKQIRQQKLNSELEVRFRNPGTKTLERIPLVSFANYYAKSLPYVNDLNYRQLYPGNISTSRQQIEDCVLDHEACVLEPDPKHPYVLWLMLKKPLPPDGEIILKFFYDLKVPKKFGSFGQYRNHLTASGGWTPYIPSYTVDRDFVLDASPPLASWEVNVTHDTPFYLNGTSYGFSNQPTNIKVDHARSLSLKVFLDNNQQDCLTAQAKTVCFAYEKRVLRADISALKGLVQKWLEFVDGHVLFREKTARVFLVQAPLRESLVRNAEHASYISDRAFRLIDALKKFHTAPVIHALFYQLLYDEVSRKESDRSFELILDALASYWTDIYLRELAFNNRDARKLTLVQWFSFLPVVDAMVYSPQFAFADVFFDSMYPFDPNRDDFWKFQHKRVSGRTYYERLKDKIGIEETGAVFKSYTNSAAPLNRIVVEKAPAFSVEDLQALEIYPKRKDYQLKGYRPVPDKKHAYKILLEREENLPVSTDKETVEVRVTDTKGNQQTYMWDAPGDRNEILAQTESNIASVEVDPRFRLLDYDRSNNRSPAQYKAVLSELYLNYDFNNSQPELYLYGQYRKRYGGLNRYNYRASYFGDSYGLGLGLVRLFGEFVDSLRLSHAASLSFGFDRLSRDTSVAYPSGVPTLIQTSPEGNAVSVSLGYFFGNQLSFSNPMSGMNVGIYGTWGAKFLGGDFDYYRFGGSGTYIYPIHPLHLLAFRLSMDRISGKDVPAPLLGRLGGSFNIRGLSLFGDEFRGRNQVIASTEYRHFLANDLDVNFGLFRLRDIQGALFTDVGSVTDTLDERVQQLAGIPHDTTNFGDLFNPRTWQSDIGYGIRFFVDYFGVGPQLLSFDFAQSLTEPSQGVRFYFRVTQSF